MKKTPSDPLVTNIWLVVQENEGLIIKTYKQKRGAVDCAKRLLRACPSMRTEVAMYLIAPNSRVDLGKERDSG